MAVAAAVVIVAITNSSQDDLEEQFSDLESRCTGTEIYDPILEAAGVEGEVVGTLTRFTVERNVNVKGSAVGCIPVCFWIDPTIANGGDSFMVSEDIMFFREFKEADNFLSGPPQGARGFTAVFRDPNTMASPLAEDEDVPIDLSAQGEVVDLIQFASSSVDPLEILVGPSQDDCFIYNSSGQIAATN